ncbi:hypothetical protein SLE2022_216330 [Rubroshorea leprosula]
MSYLIVFFDIGPISRNKISGPKLSVVKMSTSHKGRHLKKPTPPTPSGGLDIHGADAFSFEVAPRLHHNRHISSSCLETGFSANYYRPPAFM